MKALKISNSVSLPLSAVTQTFGILAVRGAGKSNLGAVMAEEMFDAGLPFVAIDPVGSWRGLRSSADGKSPGIPIPIFGGRWGDIPLQRHAGNLFADLIVDKRLSCILDLSEFDSEAQKKEFLLDFAKRLYHRNESPLHLFLEEADDYIPQKPMRDEAQLLRAWENIVRRGRARGLGITLITQRSASLNKNVLTQCETLFAMRTTGPQDQAAIELWVKYHAQSRDLLASLSSLEDGEAWIWSPHWLKTMERVRIRRRRTFDSGATPKEIRSAKPPATLADVDLSALQERMKDTIEKAKAEDPRELRKQIAELKNELHKKEVKTEVKTETKIERVEVPILKDNQIDRLNQLAEKLLQQWKDIRYTIDNFTIPNQKVRKISTIGNIVPRETKAPLPKAVPPKTVSYSNQTLSRAERKILTALAQYPEGRSKTQLAILTGYAHNGGGFNNALGSLRSKAWITGARDLRITDSGMSVLGPFDPLPSGGELFQHWMQQLSKAEREILEVLYESYPNALTKEQIAERTPSGYAPDGGGFNNAIGRLRALELAHGRGEIKASENLFL